MRFVILFLLLCLPGAALAGQRATYLDHDGKKLVIQIADDGSARVQGEQEDQYGILRGGQFYLVGREKGVWQVMRLEDMAVVLDQVMPPLFKELFNAAATKDGKDKGKSKLRFEDKGRRTVKGFAGEAYAVYGLDESKPKEAKLFVLTKDPRLQPTGQVLQQFVNGTILMMAPLLGNMAAEMGEDTRLIFSYGVPLDMEGSFKLVSLEEAQIPASATALPAEPITREKLLQELKASMASNSAETKAE